MMSLTRFVEFLDSHGADPAHWPERSREAAQQLLAANADAVGEYRSGKTAVFGFLVGQVMKAAKGKANPKRVNELLKRALDSSAH